MFASQQLIQALFETGKSNFSSEFEMQMGYLDNNFKFSTKQHFKRKQNVKTPLIVYNVHVYKQVKN